MGGTVGNSYVKGIEGLNISVHKDVLIKMAKEINRVMGLAAMTGMEITRENAPYDPKSRHARGKTRFPDVHHKNSIGFGTFIPKLKGGVDRSANFAFFGVNGIPLRNAYFNSMSGRGYWLEYGTSGKVGKDYQAKGRKGMRNLTRQSRRVQEGSVEPALRWAPDIKEHYATKAQPHFCKGFAAAKRYLQANLQNII